MDGTFEETKTVAILDMQIDALRQEVHRVTAERDDALAERDEVMALLRMALPVLEAELASDDADDCWLATLIADARAWTKEDGQCATSWHF